MLGALKKSKIRKFCIFGIKNKIPLECSFKRQSTAHLFTAVIQPNSQFALQKQWRADGNFFWLKKWLMGWLRSKNVILRACKLVKKKIHPSLFGECVEHTWKATTCLNRSELITKSYAERQQKSERLHRSRDSLTMMDQCAGKKWSQLQPAGGNFYGPLQKRQWMSAAFLTSRFDGWSPRWSSVMLQPSRRDSHRARIFAHRLLHFWSVREGK